MFRILYLCCFVHGRHQSGPKVMSVKDVVVLSFGILRLCGTRKQSV